MDFVINTDDCGRLRIHLQNAEETLKKRRQRFDRADREFNRLAGELKGPEEKVIQAFKVLGIILSFTIYGRALRLLSIPLRVIPRREALDKAIDVQQAAEDAADAKHEYERLADKVKRTLDERNRLLKKIDDQERVVLATIKLIDECERKKKRKHS